ncbi:MAG TPA: hypothetical protein VK797_25385 [Tepidisphaeraceae bacterium]|jgi:hypothetical protein|nr:hypothetical protein [Tepidisphaeraceae bacterium]
MATPDSTSPDPPSLDPCRQALCQFVQTVDATGGVFHDESGCHAPLADSDWIDLGEAYVQACAALGRDILLAQRPWADDFPAPDSPTG